MARISTIYDTVTEDGAEVKKKVFMVRGDEAYARTTDCYIELGTITTGDIKGLKIATVTINLLRTIGSSIVKLYLDDVFLKSWNTSNSTRSVSMSDVYLSYGMEHKLRAEYQHNQYCLGSKSKSVDVYRDIPENLKVTITNTASTQVNGGANVPISATLKYDDNTIDVPDGTEVIVYVDGEAYGEPLETTDGAISGTVTGLSDGSHTITLLSDTNTLINDSLSYDVYVGYDVDFVSYPQPYVSGVTNTITVRVSTYGGTLISDGATVTLDDTSLSATTSNGVATFSIASEDELSSGDYTASCNGSTSDKITISVATATSIDISTSSTVTAKGYGLPITIRVTGDNITKGYPVNCGVLGNYTTNENGVITATYDGTGYGDRTITVSDMSNTISDSKTIEDCMNVWMPQTSYYNMVKLVDYTSGFTLTEYANYLQLSRERSSTSSYIRFGSGGSVPQSVSFQVSSLTNISKIRFYNGSSNDYIELNDINYNYIKSGDVITYEVLSASCKLYVNGSLFNTKSRTSSTGFEPIINFISVDNTAPVKINLNYLKHKKINE